MKVNLKVIDKNKNEKDAELSAFNKSLKTNDPIHRNAEKIESDELSPMDPPDAYDPERAVGKSIATHEYLKALSLEHSEVLEHCKEFEKALIDFKNGGYYITKEINDAFNAFFVHMDDHVLPHNRKEEKGLFPVLHRRMLETGEHSEGENPHTPIDLMEDEHVKFIQLTSLTFNFLGLAMRLKDPESRIITLDIAYNKGMELVEILKLHIYREDNTIFPLAQKLLSVKELNALT